MHRLWICYLSCYPAWLHMAASWNLWVPMHDAILQELLKTTVLHHRLPGDGSSAKRFLMLIMFFVVEGICSVEALSPVQQRAPPKSSPLPCWHKDLWFSVLFILNSPLQNSSKSLLYFPKTLLNMSHSSMMYPGFLLMEFCVSKCVDVFPKELLS